MTFMWYFFKCERVLENHEPSITTEHFINLIAPVMDRAFLSVSAYVGEKVRERGIAPHKSSKETPTNRLTMAPSLLPLDCCINENLWWEENWIGKLKNLLPTHSPFLLTKHFNLYHVTASLLFLICIIRWLRMANPFCRWKYCFISKVANHPRFSLGWLISFA